MIPPNTSDPLDQTFLLFLYTPNKVSEETSAHSTSPRPSPMEIFSNAAPADRDLNILSCHWEHGPETRFRHRADALPMRCEQASKHFSSCHITVGRVSNSTSERAGTWSFAQRPVSERALARRDGHCRQKLSR